MYEIKCIKCKKLLFKSLKKSKGEIEIKCPRCKVTHIYRLEAPEVQD